MPQLTIDTPHSLGIDEALHRLKHKAEFVRETFGSHVNDLSEEWNENTLLFGFKTMGMKIAGTLAVEDSAVKLAADLPLAAMLFKGKIEGRVREELDKLLC